MSIEALNWARKTYVGDAMGKSLLRAIADYADENGHGWPSLTRLANDCDMSVDSVRRRLKSLEELGLVVTFRAWMDEHGKRNQDGRGRETSRDIRCMLEVMRTRDTEDTDASQDDDQAETPLANSKGGLATGEGSQQQGAGSQSARGGVALQPPLEPPLNNHLKDSPPNPPPGGCDPKSDDGSGQAEPEHFAEFRRDYPMPSMWDWRKTLGVFVALTPAEAEHARAAAALYAKQCSLPKAPKPRRPDMWLRDRMFENFPNAKLQPEPAQRVFIAENSDDFAAMCVVARIIDRPQPRATDVPGHGTGVMRAGAISPDYRAMHQFRQLRRDDGFVAEANSPEFVAWARRLHDWTGQHVEAGIVMLEGTTMMEMGLGRPPIEVRRRTHGLRVPCRWPPRKDGTINLEIADNGGEGEQDA